MPIITRQEDRNTTTVFLARTQDARRTLENSAAHASISAFALDRPT
jgi:hypothetical protein